MSAPTPETDAAEVTAGVVGDVTAVGEKWVNSKVARKLERERDEIQNELNKCATQLVATINDRNFLGVQLDLIRDEMLRIAARILESGFEKHPNLSSILDYCGRAQKGIAVNYTPIQERDAWKEKASQLERERDEARAALNEANSKIEHMMGHCGDCECRICAEIVCKHHDPLHFHHDGCPTCENPPTATQIGEAWLRDSSLEKWFPITAETLAQAIAERDDWKNNYQTAYDEWQRAAVDRDAWKAKAERTCGISEIPDGKGLFYLMTNCGGHVNGRSDWCPHCGGKIVKEWE